MYAYCTGNIRVSYTINQGTLRPLSEVLELATPLTDFQSIVEASITLLDGQSSGIIGVQIYEDAHPEVDEIFLVTLDSLQLISDHDGNFEPSLGRLSLRRIR